MSMVPRTNGSCLHCGRKFITYNFKFKGFYNSPLRRCFYCKKQYIDKNYHEIAIEGGGPKKLSPKKSIYVFIFSVVVTLISLAINFWLYQNGTYSFLEMAVTFFGIFTVICSFIYMIRIVTGIKAKSDFKTKKDEFVERMKNSKYAQTLKDCGYDVPSEYLIYNSSVYNVQEWYVKSKIPETKGFCPHCGKKFLNYNKNNLEYGSPIRNCFYCKKHIWTHVITKWLLRVILRACSVS